MSFFGEVSRKEPVDVGQAPAQDAPGGLPGEVFRHVPLGGDMDLTAEIQIRPTISFL